MLRRRAEDSLMAGLDGLDQRMVFGDFRARNGDKSFVFHPVVRMLFAKIENQLLDGHAHFL